jgi:hypothetical protein
MQITGPVIQLSPSLNNYKDFAYLLVKWFSSLQVIVEVFLKSAVVP